MRRKIESKLLELGITPNLKGFKGITDAVEYIVQNDDCLMEQVYKEVSKSCKLNGYSSAERVIRHAISKINVKKWKEMGGQGTKNSEFLFTLAFIVKGELESE